MVSPGRRSTSWLTPRPFGRWATRRARWCASITHRTSACPGSRRNSDRWQPRGEGGGERPLHPRRLPGPVRAVGSRARPRPRLEVPIPRAKPLELPDSHTGDAEGSRAAPGAEVGRASHERGHPLAADFRPLSRPVPNDPRHRQGDAAPSPGPGRRPRRPRRTEFVPARSRRLPDRHLLRVLLRDRAIATFRTGSICRRPSPHRSFPVRSTPPPSRPWSTATQATRPPTGKNSRFLPSFIPRSKSTSTASIRRSTARAPRRGKSPGGPFPRARAW